MLEELVTLFLKNEPTVSQRAAMSISALFDADAKMLSPYVNRFILALSEEGHHVAIKRSILRMLQSLYIPETQSAKLIDYCIQIVRSPKETIALKVFAMYILKKFCLQHPELKVEIVPLIEDLLDREPTGGILSCGKKVLRSLRNI